MFSGYWRMLLKTYIILLNLSNWKHTYLVEYLLIGASGSFRKGIDRKILVKQNLKKK